MSFNRPLINRAFAHLWLGQAISLTGDLVLEITILLWISTDLLKGKGYAPAVTSGLLMIVSVTTVAVAPLAGVLVDRWHDKRLVMLRADLVRATMMGLLVGVAILPSDVLTTTEKLLALAVMVAITTASSQFFAPARFVVITDAVPPEDRATAFAYAQASTALAMMLGPPLASFLVVYTSAGWAFAVNGMSFLASYVAIRTMHLDPVASSDPDRSVRQPRRSIAAEFRDVLDLMRNNVFLATLLVVAALIAVGAGALTALDVYFVREDLGASASAVGLIVAAQGVGIITGGLAGSKLARLVGSLNVFVWSLILFGGSLVAYSRLTDLVPAIALAAVIGLALGVLNTVTFALIAKMVSREHLGRVTGILNPVNHLATVFAMVGSGLLVSTVFQSLDWRWGILHLRRIDTIYLASGVIATMAGIYAAIKLRELDSRDPTLKLSDDPTIGESELVDSAPLETWPGAGALLVDEGNRR